MRPARQLGDIDAATRVLQFVLFGAGALLISVAVMESLRRGRKE